MNDSPRATRPRRSITSWLFELTVLTALWAVPFALFFGTLNGASREAYVLTYQISLVFSFMIRLSLLSVESFVVPRLRGPGKVDATHWATEGAAFISASIIASFAAAFLVDAFVMDNFLDSPRSYVVSGLFTLLFSTLFGGIAFARVFYRQALDRAAQVERIRAELARAELRALRAQINPHFLFNTLNTIAALIAENPRAAEDVVTRLADVFRYALTSGQREHSRLGDELEFLRSYLEIERSRMGERLTLVERIEPGLDALPVPSLLLQPLVENAVRYAVAGRQGGGTITIAAHREGDSLVIEITDDGPGFIIGAAPKGHGVGLESVRERMRLAGPGHVFQIDSSAEQGTHVRLTLPTNPTSHRPHDPSPTEVLRCDD